MPFVGNPEPSAGHPRTLLVDNYDSYTFNLLQLLIQQCLAANHQPDTHILVIRNNQYTWTYVKEQILPHIDNIVISPGPGTPEKEEDFGICRNLILYSNLPVLGICLGHQGIADCFGGRVVRAPVPVHGQRCLVELVVDDSELFQGIPREFMVVRYHSLVIESSDQLEILAQAKGQVVAWNQGIEYTETRDVMALKVAGKPIWGVQFHPESVCSEYGDRIVANFHRMTPTGQLNRIPEHVCRLSLSAADRRKWAVDGMQETVNCANRWSVVRRIVQLADDSDAGDMFAALFGNRRMPLWLDSANAGSKSHNNNLSIMAPGAGGSVTVRYNLRSRTVSVLRFSAENSADDQVLATEHLDGERSFWTWMQQMIDCTQGTANAEHGLEFIGGWVGYFAYEMASECLESCGHPGIYNDADAPDAQLTFVDRCVVVDHRTQPPCAHVMALVNEPGRHRNSSGIASDCGAEPEWTAGLGFPDAAQANAWVAATADDVSQWISVSSKKSSIPSSQSPENTDDAVDVDFVPSHSRAEYLDSISAAKDLITRGESYEICLTNQFHVQLPRNKTIRSFRDILRLYLSMRQTNPAPYGAVLWYDDLKYGVASCSPERFLRVEPDETTDSRRVEMKPIKGTCRRDPVPKDPELYNSWAEEDNRRKEILQADVKERAENLMIVDLIRHDLNWIAKNAQVRVPGLMLIESFSTVHQMVTTVDALVDRRISHIGALAHCFPPGSMTGAPKLRTTQIISALETQPRGAYSGCLGYFSACGKYSDWNVVIRTAVVHSKGSAISVGAGGALTILSDPKMEWAEVETKLWSAVPGIKGYIRQEN
ncbi:para-aminobenzoate synthase, (PABA) [Coemansia sp. RSA 1722]|nr:para-aminobenzoate synthase, (PABA) [Coemansia sp. RSA 486]KAJ2232757.1 para-aminobenzoate synthase, (PABA) [Coemansia sp. RSA 485]KAJ2604046.1 para-aminobenzoate synthase, (PABA) [Coemansia sp. RSA 1722]